MDDIRKRVEKLEELEAAGVSLLDDSHYAMHLLKMVDALAAKVAEDDSGGVDVATVIDWADKEAK